MERGKPGSGGEHGLQERFGTFKRAAAFYDKQMLDHLNPLMREYIAQQEMAFIATADAHGECDASFRAGSPGFIRVLDERTLMYPEYRGNGVMASLGNITENGHVGILFVDFFRSTVGLHVNGTARVIENDAITSLAPLLARMAGVTELHEESGDKKKTPERWVLVEVVEAYIHCSKHIPLLKKLDKDIDWGTDSEVRKGGDYFKAKHDPRPWAEPAPPRRVRTETAEPVAVPAAEAAPPSVEAAETAAPAAEAAAAAEAAEAAAPAAEPAADAAGMLTCEIDATVEQPAEPVATPPRLIPEPVPASETTQPAPPVDQADDELEFPITACTVPSQGEQSWFGPEIVLEELRADADSRAAAAEHTAGDPVDDLLDTWVLPEWRPAVVR